MYNKHHIVTTNALCVRILELLETGPKNAKELMYETKASQSLLSQSLVRTIPNGVIQKDYGHTPVKYMLTPKYRRLINAVGNAILSNV